MKIRMNKLKKLIIAGLVGITLLTTPASLLEVNAETNTSSTTSSSVNTDSYKAVVQDKLARRYKTIKESYVINDNILRKLEIAYNKAANGIAGTDDTTTMDNYYNTGIEEMNNLIKNLEDRKGDSFLMLSDLTPVLTANLNDTVFMPLSLINMGSTTIYDVVLTPKISDAEKWPFVISTANEPVYIQGIQGSLNVEDAMTKRMDVAYTFKVKSDVKKGIYEIPFNAYYATDGDESVSKELVTYIYINGIDEETDDSAPRIIVTGFTTEPENVFAGETFMLHITVKNTSEKLTVQNVLFDLEAVVSSGSGSNTESYAVFLPTSGSNSVYREKITPNEEYTIDIEMLAKADLAQKPYQLTVKMNYDYMNSKKELQKNATNSAEVSIPVKQESKVETGSEEITPNSIAVGEDSNIMFDVFNTGKTTLYNVKVTFDSDAITSGMTYLGNISAGETKNVDTNVTGAQADDGSGIVKAIISYEDENGNVTSVEKELNLSVYENYTEDYSDYDYSDVSYDDYNVNNGSNALVRIIVIIVVIVLVVVVAVLIFVKIRKHKKLKDDINSINDEDEL